MLNITNEGWFGETALSQKVAASVFRAVENRISLARATNTGISCFIDPYGRVIARVENNGKDRLSGRLSYTGNPYYHIKERFTQITERFWFI